jgi:hypothetical protein
VRAGDNIRVGALVAALPILAGGGVYLVVADAAEPPAHRYALPKAERGCDERQQTVKIDGASVAAFAVVCHDDRDGKWKLPLDLLAPEDAVVGTGASARGATVGRTILVVPTGAPDRAGLPPKLGR